MRKENRKRFSKALQKIILVTLCVLLTSCGKKTSSEDWKGVFKLDGTIPHSETAFTEGLFIHDGDLFESTGTFDHSCLTRYKGISQEIKQMEYPLSEGIFAEGSVVFHDTLYLLTWQNGVAILFDPNTLEPLNVIEYPREGWGLTTDAENLIASDGSDTIYFLDEDLKTVRELKVHRGAEPITNINELEYDGEYIWANIWLNNKVIAIDPETGEAVITLDFSEFLPENADKEEVCNGIAFDGLYYYFTGKNWPMIYRMTKRAN